MLIQSEAWLIAFSPNIMLDVHLLPPPTTEIVSCFTPRRLSCLMTAVASDDQQLLGRKRRRGAIEQEHSATTKLHPPRKKPKRRGQSQQETNAAYWDSLSKRWLTRRALNEVDRRNGQRVSPVERNGDKPRQLRSLSKKLKFFAKDGGPDLCDLRGVSWTYKIARSLLISSFKYPEPFISNSTARVMPSQPSSSRTQSKSRNTLGNSTAKTTTSKTRKTSPYDPNFEQYLIDNKIYPSHYDFPDDRVPPKPNNWKDINERLKEPRLSLSPSRFPDEAFDQFVRTNSRALNEDAVMSDVFPAIQGTAGIASAKNLAFGNFKPLTHGYLVDAKPDFYDGARPAQIALQIREELGSYIIPATQGQAPALPTLFAEVKGPDGNGAVAKRQACHNGVLGERGVREFMAFGMDDSETVYDNNAYTITWTYQSATGTLQVYTIHQTQPTDPTDPPEYHMTQLNSFAITGTIERFREGVGAFRNSRDWAKEQRDGLIAAANRRVMSIPKETSTLEPSSQSVSQSTVEPDTPESETSADELSQDVGPSSSLSRKRLKRKSKRSSNKKNQSRANSRSHSRGRLLQK